MRSTENSSFIRDQNDVDCTVTGNAWQVRVVSIDKVTQRRARLVLGWATADCHTTSVCECDQPAPGPTQPPTLGETGIEYQPKCGWGVKGVYLIPLVDT